MLAHGTHGEGRTREGMLACFRETTRHVRLDCPYAMAVVDAVARAVARAVGKPVDAQRHAADLLQEVGAAMVTGYRGDGVSAEGPFGVVVAELSRVLMERQRHNACGGVLNCCAADAYKCVRTAVEGVLQHSWREAQVQEQAMLMWLDELPEKDTPTQQWCKRWAGFFGEGADGGMALAFPQTRAELLDGAQPVTVTGTRVLLGARACGVRVHVTVHPASILESTPIGQLQAPARVLAGEQWKAPPAPPPEILRDGVLTVYVDGSGDGRGGWGVVVVTGGRGNQTDKRALKRAEFYGPLVR